MLDYMLEQFSRLPVDSWLLRNGLKDYIDEQLLWCEDSNFSSNFPFRETGLPQDFFFRKSFPATVMTTSPGQDTEAAI